MSRVFCNLNDFTSLLWAGNNSSSGASNPEGSSTPGSSSAKEGERTQDLPEVAFRNASAWEEDEEGLRLSAEHRLAISPHIGVRGCCFKARCKKQRGNRYGPTGGRQKLWVGFSGKSGGFGEAVRTCVSPTELSAPREVVGRSSGISKTQARPEGT